jgi:hypothetical protein
LSRAGWILLRRITTLLSAVLELLLLRDDQLLELRFCCTIGVRDQYFSQNGNIGRFINRDLEFVMAGIVIVFMPLPRLFAQPDAFFVW